MRGHINMYLLYGSSIPIYSAGIFKQSMGARNRVGKGLSYRPARLHMLAELIPCNRFLGSLKFKNSGSVPLCSEFCPPSIHRDYNGHSMYGKIRKGFQTGDPTLGIFARHDV